MRTATFLMPTAYFSIPVGVAALALAWFHVLPLWQGAETVGTVLGGIAIAFWTLFLSLYIYKLFAFREQVKEEFYCPIRFSFPALIFISTMLVGDILYHWEWHLLGKILICGSITGQLFYAFIRIGSLWSGEHFSQDAVQPPFYLPAVASNFTSASSLVILGQTDLAYLFFGAGLLAWLMFEPILLQRLRTQPLPATNRATIGIVLAPAFVGSSAYLSLNGGEVDLLVKLLWGYGLLQLLFLLRIVPSLLKNGFSIGFWAFSFGLASMANSAIALYQHSQLTHLAMIAFGFANIIIASLLFGTGIKMIKKQFWVK
ncbi:tellurite resistance protein TehA [Alysiella crassa]|uniref:Tellurite resistance protein tehA homolog n=1 Tax=Alysiella crassa TaxID=153491 RepID=A0A376BUH0_9NEIS|nr:tellurite resistance protein TehA [Alysiella crassa]SSY80443.1 Tellurite resistance protein tehA homolog [Alysiella crassa]